jgi:hypothetical protein
VKRALIEQQEREAGRIRSGEMIAEELKALGIEGRQSQKEARAGEWVDGAVEGETLEVIRRW